MSQMGAFSGLPLYQASPHRRALTFRPLVGLTFAIEPAPRIPRGFFFVPASSAVAAAAAASSALTLLARRGWTRRAAPSPASTLLTWRFARPSSHLFTRLANRSEQSDSPAEVCAGEMLESISVLQLPPRQVCSRYVYRHTSSLSDNKLQNSSCGGPRYTLLSVLTSLELRKGTCPAPLTSAAKTSPSADKLLLIACVSFSRSPVA